MFCEKCGTSVDDDQPFCPNCGNRLDGISFDDVPQAAPAPASSLSFRDVLRKIGAMRGNARIYYVCTGLLLVACFLLSVWKLFSATSDDGVTEFSYVANSGPLLANIMTVLYTLSITFFVLDLFEKFSFKWLWHFIAAAAILILVLFVLAWTHSTLPIIGLGWIYFLMQIVLAAVSVLNLLGRR
ncbi:MAG: zinc-ribbon domain-containing protein [Oscillospiraceae bacterium]|nr:zinc-ribbon domain-containing protein [Oscillospiraceae bacterium]